MTMTDKKHDEWRRRIKKRLPEIAMRVFALRKEAYLGCGFHYSLERQLGNLIAGVNDVTAESFQPISQIVLELLGTGLFKEVARIEMEISKRNNK